MDTESKFVSIIEWFMKTIPHMGACLSGTSPRISETGRLLTGQMQEIEIRHYLLKGPCLILSCHGGGGVVSQVIYAFHTSVSQYILT